MNPTSVILERIRKGIQRERLVETAVSVMAVPSRTGAAGAALDRLAEILRGEGFAVERPEGGHPSAPAVAVRLDSGRPGKTLVFNGHMDTVHLPFVAPHVDGDLISGTG